MRDSASNDELNHDIKQQKRADILESDKESIKAETYGILYDRLDGLRYLRELIGLDGFELLYEEQEGMALTRLLKNKMFLEFLSQAVLAGIMNSNWRLTSALILAQGRFIDDEIADELRAVLDASDLEGLASYLEAIIEAELTQIREIVEDNWDIS